MEPRAARRPSWYGSPARVAVLACVGIAVVASAYRYPATFSELNRTARANASQSFTDREIAGGNAVLPDQELMYQARARIPESDAYEVAVGEPVEGWSDLTVDHASGYATYFLLPRRPSAGAPWVICLTCDRGRYPGSVVWERSEEAVSIIRRSP
jgi:hypothetical protein